jgi:hypothetical protein
MKSLSIAIVFVGALYFSAMFMPGDYGWRTVIAIGIFALFTMAVIVFQKKD